MWESFPIDSAIVTLGCSWWHCFQTCVLDKGSASLEVGFEFNSQIASSSPSLLPACLEAASTQLPVHATKPAACFHASSTMTDSFLWSLSLSSLFYKSPFYDSNREEIIPFPISHLAGIEDVINRTELCQFNKQMQPKLGPGS